MRTVFKNAVILTPFRKIEGSVVVEDSTIKEVVFGNSEAGICPGDTVIDVQGRYLSPGFIELHTHGAGGYDFMDGSVDAIVNACRTHLSHGTTA